jgi:hypothetical protein
MKLLPIDTTTKRNGGGSNVRVFEFRNSGEKWQGQNLF